MHTRIHILLVQIYSVGLFIKVFHPMNGKGKFWNHRHDEASCLIILECYLFHFREPVIRILPGNKDLILLSDMIQSCETSRGYPIPDHTSLNGTFQFRNGFGASLILSIPLSSIFVILSLNTRINSRQGTTNKVTEFLTSKVKMSTEVRSHYWSVVGTQ